MLAALPALVLWIPVPASQELELRPWSQEHPIQDAYELRLRRAQEPEQRLELAVWCAEQGLLRELHALATELLAGDPDHAAARELLGHVLHDGEWRPEELARFAVKDAPHAFPTLEPRERKALLRERDRDMEEVHRGSFYELWSDLEYEDVRPYSEALTSHYKGLRNRLSFPAQDKIEVMIFGNRSDYLRFYRILSGGSGLHVAGFYVPGLRLLSFYDVPHAPAEALNTARHECTHLLIDLSFERAPLPRWLHEGLACFLAAGGEDAEGAYTAELLVQVLQRIAADETTPLDGLMRLSYGEFAGRHYPECWAWIHFLHARFGRKTFDGFLKELREAVADAEDEEACRSTVIEVFRDVYERELAALDDRWARYYRDEFALRSAQQLLDFGWRSIDASAAKDRSEEARRTLEMAQVAFAAIPGEAGPDVLRELPYARAAQLVRRVELAERDAELARLGLRAVRTALEALPAEDDPARRGRLALEALDALARASGLRGGAEAPFDYRAALLEDRARASGSAREPLEAQVVLYDEIRQVARSSLAGALSRNPLERRAARDALRLAMDYDPAGLPSVFEILRLQVEVDPDDVSQAALAAAYWGLGDRHWARTLMDEAEALSSAPATLAVYREFVR